MMIQRFNRKVARGVSLGIVLAFALSFGVSLYSNGATAAAAVDDQYVFDVTTKNGCWLSGRSWDSTKPAANRCTKVCRTGTGTYTTKVGSDGVTRGYCSLAVSAGTGSDTCVNQRHRLFIDKVGCARRWAQDSVADARQCLQYVNANSAYGNYVVKADSGADACLTNNQLTIKNSLCQVDTSLALDLYPRAVEMAAVCKTVFPQIESRLSPSLDPPLHKIVIDDNPYAAYTSGGVVHVSMNWLRTATYDPGLLPHELTHVIQAYTTNPPGWITEGMATYISYGLGYSIGTAQCYSGQRYTSGYGCGAALFNYIERVYSPTIVKDVHLAIKANTYTDQLFQTKTGKNLPALYSECLNFECQGGDL